MSVSFGKVLKMEIIPGLKYQKIKRKSFLDLLIYIYSNFSNIVDNVKELNKNVDELTKLKDLPDDDDSSPMDEE